MPTNPQDSRQVRSLWPDDLFEGLQDYGGTQTVQTAAATDITNFPPYTNSPTANERPWRSLTVVDYGSDGTQTQTANWPTNGMTCTPTLIQQTGSALADLTLSFRVIVDGIQQAAITVDQFGQAISQLGRGLGMTPEEIETFEANEDALETDCRNQVQDAHDARIQWIAQAETDAERLVREEREREAREKARVAAEKYAIAKEKGWDLLKDVIGESEYVKFKKDGYIDVPSEEKDLIYRIRSGRRIGILDREKGGLMVESQKRSLCIHPAAMFVEGDKVATHVLLCRHDEERLWKVANVHRMAA